MTNTVIGILALLLVIEIVSVFLRRKQFHSLVSIANNMQATELEQVNFISEMIANIRDIRMPLVLFLVPFKMVFGQTNTRNVNIMNKIHKNNQDLFPEFIYTAGKVLFYTSPILSVLFQVYIIVLLGLFTLISFLLKQSPKMDRNTIITNSFA